jgi:hypothetical protein
MHFVVGALIAAVILCATFHAPFVAYLVVFVVLLLFCLPFMMVRGFAHGLIDRAEDRKDARMREAARRHKKTNITIVDARTALYDSRQITIIGGKPREDSYWETEERRIAGIEDDEAGDEC